MLGMRKRGRIFILLLMVLVGALTIPVAFSAKSTGPPVTIRFAKTGSFEHNGKLYNGATFWFTNNPDKPFLAMLRGIQVPRGKNWTQYGLIVDHGLRFSLEGRRAVESALPPHESAYATVESLTLPPSGPWRVSVLVGTELKRPAAIWANLKSFPKNLKMRLSAGGGFKQTGISLSPFHGAYENTWLTSEVSTNSSDEKP